jgi:hypothetical protein
MPIHIDETSWPVVLMTYDKQMGEPEMHSAVLFYQRMFVRGQRFAVILDLRNAAPPSLANMQSFKRFVDNNTDAFRRTCVGLAFVVSGGIIMRMALRSLMQISPPPFANLVCVELAEGRAWCEGQLQAAVA